MKQLPKRDGIERPKIHRSRLGTVEMLRASLHRGIANLLAEMGETEGCRLQIVPNPHNGKARLGVLPGRKPQRTAPLVAPRAKR
jgi:hypothetical protein